ncbi:hypothetical protein J4476_01155 [Candidatus Woesearchaeota archaeon]|nr:hypothetical protein [Candidatus Woesearchaeota archaeon]HIH25763.1 hypothetical protein [Nanoarchaeota archaeon]
MEKNEDGIPKKILDELKIKQPKKEPVETEVTAIVESHQVKIPLPPDVRRHLNLKKGAKCKVRYDEEKREVVCKF